MEQSNRVLFRLRQEVQGLGYARTKYWHKFPSFMESVVTLSARCARRCRDLAMRRSQGLAMFGGSAMVSRANLAMSIAYRLQHAALVRPLDFLRHRACRSLSSASFLYDGSFQQQQQQQQQRICHRSGRRIAGVVPTLRNQNRQMSGGNKKNYVLSWCHILCGNTSHEKSLGLRITSS